MKKTIIIVALFAITLTSIAQLNGTAPLGKGDKQVNFGLGLSNHGLPLYVSMDFAVHKDVTLTPVLDVQLGENTYFGAMFKADYHWNYLMGITSNWDFYAGAHLGFDVGNDFSPSLGIQVGGRWYWSKKWGLNLEIGGGTGYATTLGVSCKL